MNAFQRDAIENGLDCWSYQHADALLMPGEAEKFVRTVQNATGRWATVFTFYDLVSAYNPVAVAEVGEWDWYFPSADYNVDQDWFRRAKLAGFDLLESHAKVVHLDGGSTTINANPVRLAIHKAKESANRDYYRAKWGGDPGEEKYRTPWNLLE